MLSLLQKIFGSRKSKPAIGVPMPHAFEPSSLIPAVEVAHLSLAVILSRLPVELRPLILKAPPESATIALPISTIVKQLPSGAVKLSLATLHRQAPAGVLGPLPPGDKRMVDVPLTEVFRHLKSSAYRRRPDQRPAAAVDSEFNLFGNADNPHEIAPTVPSEVAADLPMPPEAPMVIDLRVADEPVAAVVEEAAPAFQLAVDPAIPAPVRMLAPPPELYEPKFVKLAAPLPPPPVPAEDRPSIMLPIAPLCGGWPEPIRAALEALNGAARVALPTDEVTAGLARGRVTFTWGEIRSWMEPELEEAGDGDDATVLTLPLKVVAPIFLAATKKSRLEPRPLAFENDIPALFNGTQPTIAPPAEPVVESIPVPEPAPVEAAPMEQPAPIPHNASSIGELFRQPDKAEWTPAEIVAQLAQLPGISGAVVALQEGLLVAHSMPGDVKSEVIAAFLPQLFARLNQYAGEMRLGEVDDLLFTTHGAHCQIYRLGYVYFAVLGKPGEPLPWSALRIVADELARQTQKN